MVKCNTEETIKKFKKKHSNKYSYELVKYKSAISKVSIICSKHGIFEITPNSHLNGSGCSLCGRERTGESKKSDTSLFVKSANRVHSHKYNYNRCTYITNLDNVTITCKKHGDFYQQARKHLSGQGCKKCANESQYCNFVEKCEKKYKDYLYSKVNYKGMYSDVIITCKKHGDFSIKATNFYHKGRGCKLCKTYNKSIKEGEWLDDMGIDNINRNVYINFGKKVFCVDGIDKKRKIIYEFYGDFFHGNPEVYKKTDINPLLKEEYGKLYKKTKDKENIIISNGYKIIYIWENDYNKNKNKNGKYERKH